MDMPRTEILVVDDDQELALTLADFLRQEGYATETAFSAPEALEVLERNPNLSLALLDLMMPLTDGLALMDMLHQKSPELPVIIMTGYATIETAVEAMKRGAEDYITKPFDKQAVEKKVGRLMELARLRQRVVQLEADLQQAANPFEKLVYVSPQMQKAVERARAAAGTDAPVLIVGETGTGKEMLARAIHAASGRSGEPFAPVNCGAIPRELVESELFGVRKGAYTGAYADMPGVFGAAGRGTVFLDELGEMPKDAQVKLLRVLQERELRPLGSGRPVPVDVRIIAATNRTLQELRSEWLREDLYYRIAKIAIELPPLRARREDVLVLAQNFTTRLSEQYAREITVSRGGLELLLGYRFPGNVRELDSMLESVAALSHDDPQVLTEKDLRPLLHEDTRPATAAEALSMEEMERLAIERALRICNDNRTRAAALLGISRDTLYRKLKEIRARNGVLNGRDS